MAGRAAGAEAGGSIRLRCDEADTGVEAGDDEDGGQKHLSHPAKQAVGQCRQDAAPVPLPGKAAPEMPPMWVSMA